MKTYTTPCCNVTFTLLDKKGAPLVICPKCNKIYTLDELEEVSHAEN